MKPFEPLNDVLFTPEDGKDGVMVVVTVIVISPVITDVVPGPTGEEDGPTVGTVLDGGITPELRASLLSITLPLVANVTTPEVAGIDRVDTLADGAGGIMPESPEDVKAPVLPPVENNPTPEVTVTVTVMVPGVRVGGITPESPVEFAISALVLVEMMVPPETTDLDVAMDTLAEGAGGMIPESPVLATVAVEPDRENANDPEDTMVELEPVGTLGEPVELSTVPMVGVTTPDEGLIVEGGITPWLALRLLANAEPDVELVSPLGKMMVSTSPEGRIDDGGMTPAFPVEKKDAVLPETVALPATGALVGGMRPLPPADVRDSIEKMVVVSPLLRVVVAGTKVGGPAPPPPPFPPLVTIDVAVPEIIVVTLPWMIVVINIVLTVMGSGGTVTIVRVSVAVHSQEVE